MRKGRWLGNPGVSKFLIFLNNLGTSLKFDKNHITICHARYWLKKINSKGLREKGSDGALQILTFSRIEFEKFENHGSPAGPPIFKLFQYLIGL